MPVAVSHNSKLVSHGTNPRLTLKRLATVVHAVVRMQRMARDWKRQEELRKTLASRWDEYQRRELTNVIVDEYQRRDRVTTADIPRVPKKKNQLRFPREKLVAAVASSSSDFDAVEDSVAPLRFNVETEREDLGAVGMRVDEDLEGTEAFSVDSM